MKISKSRTWRLPARSWVIVAVLWPGLLQLVPVPVHAQDLADSIDKPQPNEPAAVMPEAPGTSALPSEETGEVTDATDHDNVTELLDHSDGRDRSEQMTSSAEATAERETHSRMNFSRIAEEARGVLEAAYVKCQGGRCSTTLLDLLSRVLQCGREVWDAVREEGSTADAEGLMEAYIAARQAYEHALQARIMSAMDPFSGNSGAEPVAEVMEVEEKFWSNTMPVDEGRGALLQRANDVLQELALYRRSQERMRMLLEDDKPVRDRAEMVREWGTITRIQPWLTRHRLATRNAALVLLETGRDEDAEEALGLIRGLKEGGWWV